MDLFALLTQYEPASEACEAMLVCLFCSEAASVQRMLVCLCTGMLAGQYIQLCPGRIPDLQQIVALLDYLHAFLQGLYRKESLMPSKHTP